MTKSARTRPCSLPWRVARGAVILLAVVWSQRSAPASATAPLGPEIGPQIERTFAILAPTLTLASAQIGPDHADVHLCRPDKSCFDAVLTPGTDDCAGVAAGSWCVVFRGGAPPEAARVVAALRSRSPSPAIPQRLAQWAGDSLSRGALLWLLCGLLPGLLLGLGAAGFRHWRRQGPWAGARVVVGVLVGGVVLGSVAAVASRQIGAFDGGCLGGLAALVVLGCNLAAPLARWSLVLGSTVLSLVLVEVAIRVLLPPPPVLQAHETSLLLPTSQRPDGLPIAQTQQVLRCAMFAEPGEETARCLRLRLPRSNLPMVVHVGDSMVFGSGVQESEALPRVWQRLAPRFSHVNAGVPGSGLDVQGPLLRRVVALRRPTRVIVYIMPGNDVADANQPIEACGGAPAQGCVRLQWAPRPWWQAWLRSPLPWPIAAATGFSYLARTAVVAQQRWVEHVFVRPDAGPAPDVQLHAWRRTLLRTLGWLKEQGIGVDVVLMPLRRSTYGVAADPLRAEIRGVLEAARIAAVDTQPWADAIVAAHGEAALYLDAPRGDIHLNAAGLARLGAWLQARIPALRD